MGNALSCAGNGESSAYSAPLELDFERQALRDLAISTRSGRNHRPKAGNRAKRDDEADHWTSAVNAIAGESRPIASHAMPCLPSTGPIETAPDRAQADGPADADEMVRDRAREVAQWTNSLGDMASGIAHDFRNVLAVIGSALNLADRESGDGEKVRHYLAAARESVERGLSLTSGLLALSRPRPPDIHPENVGNLIATFAPFLRYGAGPGIAVSLELCDEAPECMIDPAQFRAALLNLVVNARDAMPDGGEIRIRTDLLSGEAPWLRVAVTDTGHGMSEATISRIFSPWFTTKGEIGTGLGLPQVLKFMLVVDGRVEVSSELGSGTTFELLFPVPRQPPGTTS